MLLRDMVTVAIEPTSVSGEARTRFDVRSGIGGIMAVVVAADLVGGEKGGWSSGEWRCGGVHRGVTYRNQSSGLLGGSIGRLTIPAGAGLQTDGLL